MNELLIGQKNVYDLVDAKFSMTKEIIAKSLFDLHNME